MKNLIVICLLLSCSSFAMAKETQLLQCFSNASKIYTHKVADLDIEDGYIFFVEYPSEKQMLTNAPCMITFNGDK
jgi:hypothetical protein